MQDKTTIDSSALDRLFDEGQQGILEHFDTNNVHYPGLAARTVSVHLPTDVFAALELESGVTGTTVEELIEAWVEERVGLAA